jgi:hypothetical protein
MLQRRTVPCHATPNSMLAQDHVRRFDRHRHRMLAVLEAIIAAGVHSGKSVQGPCVMALERLIEPP